MTTKHVKSKIKNLRATYSQELTKIDKSIRSGAGSQEEYKSKLNWFQEMHSLIKNVPTKRKTTVRYLQSFIYYYLLPIYCPSACLSIRLKCKINVNYICIEIRTFRRLAVITKSLLIAKAQHLRC